MMILINVIYDRPSTSSTNLYVLAKRVSNVPSNTPPRNTGEGYPIIVVVAIVAVVVVVIIIVCCCRLLFILLLFYSNALVVDP